MKLEIRNSKSETSLRFKVERLKFGSISFIDRRHGERFDIRYSDFDIYSKIDNILYVASSA
jgi:hypothetical protein